MMPLSLGELLASQVMVLVPEAGPLRWGVPCEEVVGRVKKMGVHWDRKRLFCKFNVYESIKFGYITIEYRTID